MLGHFFERKQHGFSKRKIEVLIIGNWLKTRGHYLYSNEKKKIYKATVKAPEENYFKLGHQKCTGVFCLD